MKPKDKKKKPESPKAVVQFPKLGMASHLLAMSSGKKYGK